MACDPGYRNTWKGVGYGCLIYISSISGIDPSFYEAAELDGASKWKQIRYITLPSIAPVIKVTTLLSTIWTFNDFENVWLVTGGGPLYASSVISTYT